MRTKLTMATALAGALLAPCLMSGPAQATSLPVLKSDATPGIVTLVGKGHGGHGGGGGKHHGGGGGKHHYGGGGGGKHYAHKGGGKHYGGGGGGKHYGGGGKHYAYKGRDHDDHDGHNRYGHYGKYRHYGHYGSYGLPYLSYGYGGGCGWLYRYAIDTGDPYWWNRYYECIGYY
jgi:hypothetical protein